MRRALAGTHGHMCKRVRMPMRTTLVRHMVSAAISALESGSIMANNVTARLENGKLVLTCDISAGVVRRSGTKNGTVPKGTGDVLACVDFESLASLVNASGVTGEIKISLGVYLSDKARAKATQAPASTGKQAAKPVEEMSYEELRAFALQAKAREQGNVPAPAPKAPAKAPTEKQIAARQAFAERAKAGTLKPKAN